MASNPSPIEMSNKFTSNPLSFLFPRGKSAPHLIPRAQRLQS